MRSKLLLLIIIWCIFMSPFASGIYRRTDSKNVGRRPSPVTEHVEMSCKCKNQVAIEIFNISMPIVFDIVDKRTPCHLTNHARICELLEECEFCTAETERCLFRNIPGIDLNRVCQKLKYNFETSKSNIIQRSLPDTAFPILRLRRDADSCYPPKALANSILKFVYSPKEIRIIQKCKYGYTLSDGISREMWCRYAENRWYPEGLEFEACRPFIHCQVALRYHGSANCSTGTTDVAPVCHVSCPRYEDKSEEKGTSECDIDGIWKPKLPHCAIAVNAMDLVPAPRIKLHRIEQAFEKGSEETKPKKKQRKQ